MIKIVRVKPPEGAIVSTFKRRRYDYQNDVGAAICCDWIKTVWSPRGDLVLAFTSEPLRVGSSIGYQLGGATVWFDGRGHAPTYFSMERWLRDNGIAAGYVTRIKGE